MSKNYYCVMQIMGKILVNWYSSARNCMKLVLANQLLKLFNITVGKIPPPYKICVTYIGGKIIMFKTCYSGGYKGIAMVSAETPSEREQ